MDELNQLKAENQRLRNAMVLAESQYKACGGGLSDRSVVASMRDVLNRELKDSQLLKVTDKLVDRLKTICTTCLWAPENRHSEDLRPFCKQCKLKWEAVDEIEYLEDCIKEMRSQFDHT